MKKKGGMPSFRTIDDYISNQTIEAQVILNELRELIKEAVPAIIEIENYKVPSFTLVEGAKPAQQMMMAAHAKYVSFYPYQAAIEHFKEKLTHYEIGKGTIKFPYNKPLPKELIKRLVVFRKTEILRNLNTMKASSKTKNLL